MKETNTFKPGNIFTSVYKAANIFGDKDRATIYCRKGSGMIYNMQFIGAVMSMSLFGKSDTFNFVEGCLRAYKGDGTGHSTATMGGQITYLSLVMLQSL